MYGGTSYRIHFQANFQMTVLLLPLPGGLVLCSFFSFCCSFIPETQPLAFLRAPPSDFYWALVSGPLLQSKVLQPHCFGSIGYDSRLLGSSVRLGKQDPWKPYIGDIRSEPFSPSIPDTVWLNATSGCHLWAVQITSVLPSGDPSESGETWGGSKVFCGITRVGFMERRSPGTPAFSCGRSVYHLWSAFLPNSKW